ncbi:hypothetical protein G6F65_013316 [Rhizopus arrhizus]|nr:hypothetical protein G6F65_013316 [Rhizopus arrhizus]
MVKEITSENGDMFNNFTTIKSFMARPEPFYGVKGENPGSWLRSIDRIRKGTKASDLDILLIVGTLLKGNAGIWWDSIEDYVTTWGEFKTKFLGNYINEETKMQWRKELKNKKQCENESIDELVTYQLDMFQRLGWVDEGDKIEVFISALKEEYAYEVERARPLTWEAAVKDAKQLESLSLKYNGIKNKKENIVHTKDFGSESMSSIPVNQSSNASQDAVSSLSSEVKSLTQQLNALKIYATPNRNMNGQANFTCYSCGQVGHKSFHCPNREESAVEENHQNSSTGKNIKKENMNYGKKQENHGRKINVVQGVQVWNNRGAVRTRSELSSDKGKQTVTQKRQRKEQQPVPIQQPVQDYQQILMQQRQQQPNQQYMQQLRQNASNPTPQQLHNSMVEPIIIDPPVQKNIKVKKKRAPARRLEVDVPSVDIWEILKEKNADVSCAQLLAMNKIVAKDLIDGIRGMHGRKPNVRQVNMARPAPDVLTLDSYDYSDDEMEDGAFNEEEDGDDDDDDAQVSYCSFGDEVSSCIANTGSNVEESEFDGDSGDDADTEFDYSYDYREMSKSEPLTVKVIIHDKELSAIVDTGAAISVMSEALVKKLDLKTNEDTVSIQLLDGTNSKPGGVVPNVPVRIGGKLRTEHFAIQKGRKDELLILGMTWLKNYGIIPDPESGTW